MASAATRREGVRVDVVLPVAVDAQVSGAREATVVDVALLAALLIVSSLELEVAYVVQRHDVRERICGVTGLAHRSKLAFMHLGLGVAGASAVTVRGPRLEGNARMTIGTTNRQMLAGQDVITLRIVIENVLACLEVAALALLAEPSAMGIVFGVTSLRGTVCWRL